MLNAATAYNLERKAHWADNLQFRDGVPLPSWIDLNVTELCNRKCVFCPRVDSANYPNQRLHMAIPLARKIADELKEWSYDGAIVLSGFSEPLLHPRIVELVAQFGQDIRVEVVSNGDRLSAGLIGSLIDAGVDFFAISMYDGPHQIAPLNEMFVRAGYDQDYYILRDRWHSEEADYGLKLTNRAGAIDAGHQPAVDVTERCHYPSYSMTVDWDGRVLLCVQDWQKRVTFGNVHDQTLFDIWTSTAMHKRRMQLLRGRAGLSPCSGCNACGLLHGADHAAAWTEGRRLENVVA